jgi:predicted phosphate transport protein (TIGR00153 family)
VVFKKKDFFFITLENIADNLLKTSERFIIGIQQHGHNATFAKEMKDFEHIGDEYTHAIYTALNKTFITPIDREDIVALASSLDDVLDGIEACASRFEMYEVTDYDVPIIQFAEIIHKSVLEIQQAIRLMSTKKLLPIRIHTIKINELENQADDLLRSCIKDLFRNIKDPIELIKRKDIYEMLESATDACEDVANTMESIIMRNS